MTNAGAAHLEGLGSIDGVADAKAELYAGLPATGVAVANADDPRMLKRAQASGRRVLTFAVGAPAARRRRRRWRSSSTAPRGCASCWGSATASSRWSWRWSGAHNAANAAAAAAAAVALGCTDREIVARPPRGPPGGAPPPRRAARERPAAHRRLLQRQPALHGGRAPDALRPRRERRGRARWRCSGTCSSSGPSRRRPTAALGEAAARAGVALLAAFGPRSRATAEAAAAAGLPADRIFHTEDVDALVGWARERLRPSDVLLVKASRGMKLERLVEALS